MENPNSLRSVKVICGDDAALRVVDGKGVELLFISLPPGPQDLTQYHPLTEQGLIELASCLIVSTPAGKLKTIHSGEHFDSAANPDFQVSAATRQEQAMRAMVNRVVQSNMERYAPARKKAAEPTEVIEEEPTDGTVQPAQTEPAGSGQPEIPASPEAK